MLQQWYPQRRPRRRLGIGTPQQAQTMICDYRLMPHDDVFTTFATAVIYPSLSCPYSKSWAAPSIVTLN